MSELLTGLGETSQPIRSTPHGSQVPELLALYQKTMDAADDLRPVPMVLWKRRGRLHYLPCPKWLVRHFIVRHVRLSLTDLSRRYSGRAALGQAALGEQHDRKAVRDFQESLPPDRQKVYLALLIAGIALVVPPLGSAAVSMVNKLAKLAAGATTPAGAGGWQSHFLGAVVRLDPAAMYKYGSDGLGKVTSLAIADAPSMDEAASTLAHGGPLKFGVLTLCVALCVYMALLPFGPAFRLKRMLFNLAPEPKGRHRSVVTRWSVSEATGLYESEHRVFAQIGARPPKEFPFDLAVSALAMALLLAYCGLLFLGGVIARPEHRTVGGLAALGAACLLIPILVRVGWLYQTWWRRQLGRSRPRMPYEIGIRGGSAVATVENPIGWRLLFSLVLFIFVAGSALLSARSDGRGLAYASGTALLFGLLLSQPALLFITLPWWHRMNRELRDLDRSYPSQETGVRPRKRRRKMTGSRLILYALFFPVLLYLSFAYFFILPVIAAFTIGRHIRKAQAKARQPVTALSPGALAWVLVPGLLFLPLLFAHLQHALNKVWEDEGRPLDPWSAESSPEVNCFTGALPWLKAKRSTD
jgi:hypothetical protein